MSRSEIDSANNRRLPWQKEAFDQVKTLMDSGRHTTVMIRGPRGIGKSRLALALAEAHITKGGTKSTKEFDKGSHPDFLVVVPPLYEEKREKTRDKSSDMVERMLPYLKFGAEHEPPKDVKNLGEREVTIDHIRELLKFCAHTPKLAKRRVVVVYPACRMNEHSSNSFLKLLEDTPDTAFLLLVAHQPDRLPPTVLSRCLMVDATVPTPEQSSAWLESVNRPCPEELIDLYKFAPTEFARLEDADVLKALVSFLGEDGRPHVGDIAAKLAKTRPADWTALMAKWVGDLVATKFGADPIHFTSMRGDLGRIARKARHMQWLDLQAEFAQLHSVTAKPVNAQLLAERTLGEYAALAHRR